MAEPVGKQVWLGRGIFIALMCAIIFWQLLPLDQRPTLFSPPDLLLVTTLVWVTRRPEYAPFYVIGVVFFLADLLFQRPPGLMAALVLVASEVIRSRALTTREMPVVAEFGLVAVAVILIALANRAVLAMVLMPVPYQVLELLHVIATLVAIPFVILAAHLIFGVRRPTPGDVSRTGQRI